MAIIGLDIGTTCCKCGVYQKDGQYLGEYFAEYEIVRNGGYGFADIASMWAHTKKILAQAAKDNDIESICVTSFGESFVPVTSDFKVLSNSMLYTDPRGHKQVQRLSLKLTNSQVFKVTGHTMHSMYSLPKIMWIKDNQIEIYNKTYKFLPIASFILFMLSGVAACDYSLCARTMAFDINKKCWSNDILDAAQVDVAKLPTPVKSGEIIANIMPSLAQELNINKNCKIIAGAHDQVCAAVGAGALDIKSAAIGIGTVECITPVFDRQVTNNKMAQEGYSCVPYAVDNTFVSYLFNYTGGAMLKWFRDKIAYTKNQQLTQNGQSFYGYYDSAMPTAPSNLLVLAHFAGAATPYMDIDAKGAIINMGLDTSDADIYRAIMEGCSFEMLLNMQKVKEYGIEITSLTATGGGANSKTWLQIKADILGVPIYPLENQNAGIAGAAMLSLCALGYAKSLHQAAQVIVRKKAAIYPNTSLSSIYGEKFEKYAKLYDLLKVVR